MASRESGGPRPEHKAPAPAEKKPAETKDTKTPAEKPEAASPADRRLKSKKRKEIKPDGTIIVEDQEFYPDGEEVAGEGSKEKDGGKTEGKTPDTGKEGKEDGKDKSVTGDDVVKEVEKDPDASTEVKNAVKGHDHGHGAAKAVENTKVGGTKISKLWEKVKPALGGFLAGAAARSGIRFFAKRALDATSFGASIAAGGIVGGGMEYYKANKAENKRLYDMHTYDSALTDYDTMETDLERVKALVAVEEALKENIKSKKMTPTQRAEYGAKLMYLRTKIESVKSPEMEAATGVDKLKLLLQYRSKVDRQQLSAEQNKDIDSLLQDLKTFKKERGLTKDGWKIARSTLYGAAVGAVGGAVGEWALEHAGHFAADKGLIPEKWGFHVGSSSGGYGLHNPAEVAHAAREAAALEEEMSNMTTMLFTSAALIGVGGATVGVDSWLKNKRKSIIEADASGRVLGDLNTPAPEKPKPAQENLILAKNETEKLELKARLEILNRIKAQAKEGIDKAGQHLEGNKPNLKSFKEEWEKLHILLGTQQVENLVNGSSKEETEQIRTAWKEMVKEFNVIAKTLEEKADKIEKQEQAEDDGDGGEDDKGDPEKKKKTKEGGVEGGWQAKYDEESKKFGSALLKVPGALRQGDFAKAESHHLEAIMAISALAVFAKGLTGEEQKLAEEEIEAMQKKADLILDKIKKAKEPATQPEAEVKPAAPEAPKTQDELDADKLRLADVWKIGYYRKMVEFGLMQGLGANDTMEEGSANISRLNKFILLANEKNSIFEKLSAEGGETFRKRFLSSLTKLKQGNPGILKKLCLDLLYKGQDTGKVDEAQSILGVMDDIGAEVRMVADQARAGFKPKKKKTK